MVLQCLYGTIHVRVISHTLVLASNEQDRSDQLFFCSIRRAVTCRLTHAIDPTQLRL
jgi:hypothetical protein